MMTATLSCDHRAVDAALGAELLSAFKGFVEQPGDDDRVWIMRGRSDMTRKCIISAVVMFVMAWALSFVVHGLLLARITRSRRACARRPRRRRSSTI